MAAGLATGVGYIGIAVIFTVILCLANILYTVTGFGESISLERELKITVPEDLNYTDMFEDLFEEHTSYHRLKSIKTSNMGSLYKLSFSLRLKNPQNEKALIDSMRCRNGNLEIVCCCRAANEEIIKITAEGTYVVTGKHKQIVVSAPDTAKVQIVLKNAEIENNSGPAIYITAADKVFITALAGTESSVTDSGEYSAEYTDTNVDAAIFSRADLTLNGKGVLNVTGNLKCGIASKDDLVICGLTLNVTSTGRAIEGKDCVKCSDAAVSANAGDDGINAAVGNDSSGGMGGQPDRGMGGGKPGGMMR